MVILYDATIVVASMLLLGSCSVSDYPGLLRHTSVGSCQCNLSCLQLKGTKRCDSRSSDAGLQNFAPTCSCIVLPHPSWLAPLLPITKDIICADIQRGILEGKKIVQQEEERQRCKVQIRERFLGCSNECLEYPKMTVLVISSLIRGWESFQEELMDLLMTAQVSHLAVNAGLQ